MMQPLPSRRDWIRALCAHPVDRLKTLAATLTAGHEVRVTTLPQAGLGLLTLKDGAFHEPYYLGEFPLSVCRVDILTADGRQATGGAQVIADDADLAYALAILDAVLAADWPEAAQIRALLETGCTRRVEEERRRRAILSATRVDFAMLSDAEGVDAD